MIAGRKLLLADDSVAIQKVIDLTFTDEGMEVTTVGDGQDALAKLEQSTPDVVLADIYMPGVDGYELCKFIKQNERFRGVPVMLLVGSFEPFDETEAKRAGADDVVTKPFQSIRDLVSRVRSLLRRGDAGGNAAVDVDASHEDIVVAETHEVFAESIEESAPMPEQPPVKVFVEAPMMENSEAEIAPEHTCPADIELQTADTQQLKPVATSTDFDDTIELEVVDENNGAESASAHAGNAVQFTGPARAASQSTMSNALDDEGVLDLGDVDGFAAAPAEDDFELDLDVEPVEFSSAGVSIEHLSDPGAAPVGQSSFERASASAEPTTAAERQMTRAVPGGTDLSLAHLSPEAIEAISRRVVEKLSDQVVREIAWEVVPELSELLIKKQLQERQ